MSEKIGRFGYGNAPEETHRHFRRVTVRVANARNGRKSSRKCFLMDVNAFVKLAESASLGKLPVPLHELNIHIPRLRGSHLVDCSLKI